MQLLAKWVLLNLQGCIIRWDYWSRICSGWRWCSLETAQSDWHWLIAPGWTCLVDMQSARDVASNSLDVFGRFTIYSWHVEHLLIGLWEDPREIGRTWDRVEVFFAARWGNRPWSTVSSTISASTSLGSQNRISRRLNKQGCWQIRKPQLGSLSSSSHPLSIQYRVVLYIQIADASLSSVCGTFMLVTRFFRNDFTGIKASLLLQLLVSGIN